MWSIVVRELACDRKVGGSNPMTVSGTPEVPSRCSLGAVFPASCCFDWVTRLNTEMCSHITNGHRIEKYSVLQAKVYLQSQKIYLHI